MGATISTLNHSGIDFLNKKILSSDGQRISLYDYMNTTKGGEPLDFKILGTKQGEKDYDNPLYLYRGVPLDGMLGLNNASGVPMYGSARDVGNIGAGEIAGASGLSWFMARLRFDGLETKQNGYWPTQEGQPTQQAQRISYDIGIRYRK